MLLALFLLLSRLPEVHGIQSSYLCRWISVTRELTCSVFISSVFTVIGKKVNLDDEREQGKELQKKVSLSSWKADEGPNLWCMYTEKIHFSIVRS